MRVGEMKMKALPFLTAIACSATLIASAAQQAAPAANSDSVATLVSRLDLERYKATIKGLTQFGDRRQGTARNVAAIDWIEAQLKSYGCATERLKYDYLEPGRTGSEPRVEVASPANGSEPARTLGGGRGRYLRNPTGLNGDPNKQRDAKLRALDTPPAVPGPREEVYCTMSAGPIRTKCTSSPRIWTDMAGAKQPMTTVRARHLSWSLHAS